MLACRARSRRVLSEHLRGAENQDPPTLSKLSPDFLCVSGKSYFLLAVGYAVIEETWWRLGSSPTNNTSWLNVALKLVLSSRITGR